MGYELVGVERLPQPRRGMLLRLYIDHEDGITLADCERVSHQVSGILDVEDPIPGEYLLEVSSPGLDRPLVKREHFERFIGSVVRLQLHRPLNGRRRFKGKLLAVTEEDITVEDSGEHYTLPLGAIERARLVPGEI